MQTPRFSKLLGKYLHSAGSDVLMFDNNVSSHINGVNIVKHVLQKNKVPPFSTLKMETAC